MTETISVEEYRALVKPAPKYGNKKRIANGIAFDSKAEETRWGELLLLESAGKIEDLTCQPSYELQPAFTDAHGRRRRAIHYVADFSYTDQGRAVAEDVKGGRATATAVFLLKAKLFAYRFPGIELRIIER